MTVALLAYDYRLWICRSGNLDACFGLFALPAYTLNRREFWRRQPENFITDFIGAASAPTPTTRPSTTLRQRL